MTNLRVTLFCLLCCLTQLGCQHHAPPTMASDAPPAQKSAPEVVGMVTLEVGSGVRVRATAEKSAGPDKGVVSRLVLRNLSDGRVIYDEDCGECTLQDPDIWLKQGTALVVLTKGAVANGVRVLEVSGSGARVVLEESSRVAPILMPGDEHGGEMALLVADSESANDPLLAKRYEYGWKEEKFVLTGTAEFAQVVNSVRGRFKPASK